MDFLKELLKELLEAMFQNIGKVITGAVILTLIPVSIRIWVKTGSKQRNAPKQNVENPDGSEITQQCASFGDSGPHATASGNFIHASGGSQIFNIGSLALENKKYAFSEIKLAAENLSHSVDSFFFSALGNEKIDGFLSPKSFDADGKLKKASQLTTARALDHAKKSLKGAVEKDMPKFKEEDQVDLHEILDPLLKIKIDEILQITEDMKLAVSTSIAPILSKYLGKQK